jgi:two-component system, OmpR family, phosphate regulon sensor histidine kinase PhoR
MAVQRRLLWQIFPACLLVTLASLAAVTWYASEALYRFYIDRTADELQSQARLVEPQFCELVVARNFDQVDALCKRLGEASGTRLTVILPGGKVKGDSVAQPAKMENHAGRPEIARALAGEPGASVHQSETLQEKFRYVAIPLRSQGRVVGVLRAAISLGAIDQALHGVRRNIAVGSLAVAAVLAGVSLMLSRRITRPLEELQRGAERFARGDLAYRLPIGDSLELAMLAETMNHMAADLDEKLQSLVHQRNEREAIFASMGEGVLAIDARERILRLNQAAARLLEVDPARAEGRTLLEVVRNVDLSSLVAAVLETHEALEGEVVLRGHGERYLYVHGTVLHGMQPGASGALVVLRDVTELKKLETVRRDFVANVSHELRTPVTSIKGFVETLLDGAMHDAADLERFLRIVATQTDRLNAIIEDLLMLARVEQGAEKAEIALAAGAVRPVLEGALTTCGRKAADKKVRLELTCPAELTAAMNAPLLEQAVVNLIDNAVKYSPAGQSITVEALRADEEVLIRVTDRGCGIGPEHLTRIFERFYRVDKARSRELGGTGLGLAIVKHIANSHHGRVTVQSTVGHGSVFTIFLPAC